MSEIFSKLFGFDKNVPSGGVPVRIPNPPGEDGFCPEIENKSLDPRK